MSVTLEEILTLAGELDDAQGFDTPRERFRRFLLEHAQNAGIVRSFVEVCQHTPGVQHRRALQDLTVLLGRFLGFDAAFGSYLPITGQLTYHGQWRSRSRLQVAVEVRSEPAAHTNLDSLLRSVAALKTAAPAARFAGLCVVAPLYMRRERVEKALAAAKSDVPMGVVTLGGLLSLAEMAGEGRITHDEVLRLIESNISIDFVVGMIERSAAPHDVNAFEPARSGGGVPPLAPPESDAPHFWIATVAPDHATPPEEVLEQVAGRRHLFGLTEGPVPGAASARRGDDVCFYIFGKGIVGRARIAGVEASGTGIRAAHRFQTLLRLEYLDLHVAAPASVDPETQLRLAAAAVVRTNTHAQVLVDVSRERFLVLTRQPGGDGADPRTTILTDPGVSAEDSR